jgi:hypothetical protein
MAYSVNQWLKISSPVVGIQLLPGGTWSLVQTIIIGSFSILSKDFVRSSHAAASSAMAERVL